MMSAWRTTPTSWPVVVDDRHVPVAPGLHQDDRVADRLVEVERVRIGGHQRLDRLAQVDVAADDPAEDVALGQDADEAAVRRRTTKTESPVPVRWIARRQSASEVPGGTVTGWRRLSTPQPLVGEGRDAARRRRLR